VSGKCDGEVRQMHCWDMQVEMVKVRHEPGRHDEKRARAVGRHVLRVFSLSALARSVRHQGMILP
jgi:hypothetical protein